ncbi:hypothetical protein [Motilimonas cestriensis]|uniref:hypothetical protein n=1 Tax=Motilimonas cestriensis TaxID=2742685 RepID=UPI003DA4AB5F
MNRSDLKIFKPESLGQTDDAGGYRSKNEVVSGKLSDLLTPISDIDHAQSALDMVKFYPTVDTPDAQLLQDGHVFISQPLTDPKVTALLIESDALSDASTLADMREILGSAVTPGLRLRTGLSGLSKNQNVISAIDLETGAAQGEPSRVSLSIGQIVAICVEYDGEEDATWPRRNHYAQITSFDTAQRLWVFEPAIAWPTPERDTLINGQSKCSVLRCISTANETFKAHGVSKLTAPSSGQTLQVAAAQQSLLPMINTEKKHLGQNPNGAQSDIVRTVAQFSATSSSTYRVVVDALTLDLLEKYPATVSYTKGGELKTEQDALVRAEYDGNERYIQLVLAELADAGSFVSVSYISADNYEYREILTTANANPLAIAKGSLQGTFDAFAGGTTQYVGQITERDDGVYGSDGNGTKRIAIIDYAAGTYADINNRIRSLFGLAVKSMPTATEARFVLPFSNVVLDSLYVSVTTATNTQLSASGDNAGVISGSGITGSVSGNVVELTFSSPVKLSTLSYDVTELVSLLPPPDRYGINPLRVPKGGLVDIYRPWGVVCLSDLKSQLISPVNGATHTVRANSRIDILDANQQSLWTATGTHFSYSGTTVTIKSDFAGFTGPFVLTDNVSELALVTQVVGNEVSLSEPLANTYPAGATVASVQVLGDLQARIVNPRVLSSFNNNWDNDSALAEAKLNPDFPIETSNNSAINEDWALIMTSPTAFRCIGRRFGQLQTGDTLNDFALLNPKTGDVMFTIPVEAFGSGYNAGEVIRFQQVAASRPAMLVRATNPGHSNITQDSLTLAFRGNA